MTDAFDAALLGAVVLTAILAVSIPRRTAATACFLVFGILLALLWGRFNAPDIALAEAALGGGIAGALLVDALGRRQPQSPRQGGWVTVVSVTAAVVAGAATFTVLALTVTRLDFSAGHLAALAQESLDATGVSHPITAVLLSYRTLDTLLEIAVLVVAVFGARAVAGESIRTVRTSDPVRTTLAVLLLPVLIVLAVWMLVAGTTRPGGAFQAGAILGAALVIGHLCGIPFTTPSGRAGMLAIGGSLVFFICFATAGVLITGWWFGMHESWAGAAILALEAVLALGIGLALAMIFLVAGSKDAALTRSSAVIA